ncbi:MAG TPA: PA2169 family four-helix-bundle protein [Chitinophagales bacterium]|nr:PA2169 family four-helix-bundle protein [Chitinophagales bacterium]
MKTVSEKQAKALSDLIIINNDRYEGYNKAAEQTTDADLKSLFTKLSLQSKEFSSDLRKLVPFTEEAPERDETTVSGKFYRAWMDVKSALTSKDRKAILSSCEFGEDVAKKTYDDVLDKPEDIPSDVLSLVQKQRRELQQGHDTVKALRDSAKN